MKATFKKLTLSPFFYSVPSVGDCAKAIMLFFIPQFIMLFYTKSYASILLIIVTVAASVLADCLFCLFNVRKIKPSSTVYLRGIITGMLLPASYPPMRAFIVFVLVLIISEYVFGGFAQSWVNSIAVSLVMFYFMGSTYFPESLLNIQNLQTHNIGASFIRDGQIQTMPCDALITSFLNMKIFRFTGISLPEGYLSLFWDSGFTIPAFRFNLLTIISTLFLITFNYIDWLIPLIYLTVYLVLIRIFGLFPYGGILFNGDILLAMLSSGTLFTAFFVLNWYGTVPQSIFGKILYAFFAGVAAFLIIGSGTSPIGSMFVVLLANMLSPFFQIIENFMFFSIFKKRMDVSR